MKLSQIALVSVAAATCCVGLRAYQRVADFGFGNDDAPNNVKAEFYSVAATVAAVTGGAPPGRAIIPRLTVSF